MTSENDTKTRDYAGLNRAVFVRMTSLRKARGWSVQRLADELTAVGRPTKRSTLFEAVSRENSRCPVDLLFALAAVFGSTAEELLDPICGNCNGRPPAGFSCTSCGRVA